jgi:plastocyanin
MNKTLLGVIAAIIVVAGVGFVLMNKADKSVPATNTTQTTTTRPAEETETNNQTPANTASEAKLAATVNIQDMAFTPQKVTIKKGGTVTWTNQDSDRHDVTPDNESSGFTGSELLDKGESYEFTFNEVGSYSYHCSPHPQMTGTVEVVE